MLVRPALPSKADGCVGVLAFPPEYLTSSTHDVVRNVIGEHRTRVADDGGDVVGLIVIECRHPRAAETAYAAVHPARQVQGVGSMLLAAAIDELRATDPLVAEAIVAALIDFVDRCDDAGGSVPSDAADDLDRSPRRDAAGGWGVE